MKRFFTGPRRLFFVLSLALNVLALVILAFVLLPRDRPDTPTHSAYGSLFEHRATRADVHAEPAPSSVLAGARPRAAPAEQLLTAPVDRIRIESIGVDAPLVALNLDATGSLASPDGPQAVAWYEFTAKPGLGGNAVFSGHVDYIRYGPAVFWDLRKLQPGDRVEISLKDGALVAYSVVASHLYPLAEVPMGEILAPTPVESVTLITCGGTFGSGGYSHRLVVRATRTGVTLPAAP
jgi:LPXTG-site transpeptidase (sortase) family protein